MRNSPSSATNPSAMTYNNNQQTTNKQPLNYQELRELYTLTQRIDRNECIEGH